jgi:aerobic carbon-monoxide dehydrogenase large subunit
MNTHVLAEPSRADMVDVPPLPWTGRALERREDSPLLQGKGQFVDDLYLPNIAHVRIYRSDVAHAAIRSYDLSAVRATAGVVEAVTASDLAGEIGPFPNGLPYLRPLRYSALAEGRVRFVGEPLVAVVADDPATAEDAAEKVRVELERLPTVATAEQALADPSVRLYDEWDDNVSVHRSAAFGDVDGAFAAADLVLDETFYQQRQTALPLELRGCVASYDGDRLSVWSSTQTPHQLRTLLASVLRMPEGDIRVVAPDVGGGFGVKYQLHREEVLAAALAKRLGRPVKWIEDMWEHLASATQSRDKQVRMQMAVQRDGTILALRADITVDVGSAQAYPYSYGSTLVLAGGMPLGLKTHNYAYDYRCVVTNKAPSGAYRGFGNPMRVFVVERSMDLIAERLGLDRMEVRRRNLISQADLPYRSATGTRISSGTVLEALELGLQNARYSDFPLRQQKARAGGRYVGIGFAAFAETAVPSYWGMVGAFSAGDPATVRIEPDGSVTALVGTAAQGQGHRTAFAQVLADALHVMPDRVTVQTGDTAVSPYGLGAWGSRSMVVAGGAMILAAEKIRAKLLAIGAHLLSRPASALRFDAEGITDGETGRMLTLSELVAAAYAGRAKLPIGMEGGLEATAFFEPESIDRLPDSAGRAMRHGTVSNQAHIVTVEVRPETGETKVLDYLVVHDCGVMVNPALVEGQVRGGVAQGIAGTLFEEIRYDRDGNLLTGSLVDYQVPTARELPPVRVLHLESPDPTVPGGFKGMAEGGTLGAAAAVANAIADALKPLGVHITTTRLNAVDLSALISARREQVDPHAVRAIQEGGD